MTRVEQCYYFEGVLIPQCCGCAVFGIDACTCRFRPSKRHPIAQRCIELTNRKSMAFTHAHRIRFQYA